MLTGNLVITADNLPEAYPLSLDMLIREFRALFLYTWPTRPTELDTPLEAELYRLLYERFFELIYVPRPVQEKAILDKLARQPVVVAGERGCGKSTLIASVERQLCLRLQRADDLLIAIPHVDCNDFRLETTAEAIYEEIFAQLWDALFVARPDVERESRFWTALVTRPTSLVPVRECRKALRALVSDALTEETHWARALADHPSITETLRDQFDDLDAATRMTELAKLLPVLEISSYIVVDNVDHLQDTVQMAVLTLLVAANNQSGRQLVPLVALRTENYKRARRELVGASVMAAEILTDSANLFNHAHETVVGEYLARRVSVLTRTNLPKLFETLDSPDGQAAAERLGFPSGERMFRELTASAQFIADSRTIGAGVPVRVLHDLDRWCNYSLRDVGLSLANLAWQLLSMAGLRGGSPNAMKQWPARFRDMRNHLIRQHVLYDKALAIKQPPHVSALLFESARRGNTLGVPFLDYHLLAYLTAIGAKSPVPLHTIHATFSELGLPEAKVTDRLRALSEPRDEDDSGLIRTTGLDRTNCEIEILSSGKFTARFLVRTYEYSFWNASYMPTLEFLALLKSVAATCLQLVESGAENSVDSPGFSIFQWSRQLVEGRQGSHPVPYRIWTNPSFRAAVAHQYIVDKLAPEYWRSLTALDEAQREQYFYTFPGAPLPSRIMQMGRLYLAELLYDRSIVGYDRALIESLDRDRAARVRVSRRSPASPTL